MKRCKEVLVESQYQGEGRMFEHQPLEGLCTLRTSQNFPLALLTSSKCVLVYDKLRL